MDKAQQRAEVILKVRSGEITATEGAQQLGISRKTYYEWESKALAGLLAALEDGESGRPAQPVDEEKLVLTEKIVRLETELEAAKQTVEVRNVLAAYEKKQQQLAKAKNAGAKKSHKGSYDRGDIAVGGRSEENHVVDESSGVPVFGRTVRQCVALATASSVRPACGQPAGAAENGVPGLG
jgi:hypothetical protein